MRKPLKKVRNLGPKDPRFSILLLYVSCNTNDDVCSEDTAYYEKQEATEYAKV